MRSRTRIVDDLTNVVSDIHDRMTALAAADPDSAIARRYDRMATVLAENLGDVIVETGAFFEQIDKELGKRPPSSRPHRPSNVISLRPGTRRRSK